MSTKKKEKMNIEVSHVLSPIKKVFKGIAVPENARRDWKILLIFTVLLLILITLISFTLFYSVSNQDFSVDVDGSNEKELFDRREFDSAVQKVKNMQSYYNELQ